MSKENELNFLGGSEEYSLGATGIGNIIGLFQKRVAEEAEKSRVIDSGRMLSGENFKQTITEKDDLTIIDLFMVKYADYVNQGVKGVDSSKNAPNSPYQYKNYGMPEEARKSILNSVISGKMKVSDISRTKYGKIGLESKSQKTPNQQDINERETNQIVYLIKKFGIKETGFINRAWELFKQDLQNNLKEFAEKKIVFTITKG